MRETVLLEVAHAFGLNHTQKFNEPYSVMRGFGFNNMYILLTDDYNGLATRYP
ncbi:hypothetical protein [Sporosarcina sp. FA9]|uniref:hypothetical protein n=1 Tax=Sporosarcina sp. FA9 TaxID=3413030 RepID=UPI003F6588FD